MPTTIRRSLSPALTMMIIGPLTGLIVALCPASMPSAHALTLSKAQQVLRVAASKKGAPYKWGAEGPRRFDCSGYTMWVFHRVGRRLPRLAASQYRATRHIRRHHRRRGDLVFFHRGRRVRSIYHVGIYAGRGMLWEAPHTGARVRKERIWTRKVWYGRVR